MLFPSHRAIKAYQHGQKVQHVWTRRDIPPKEIGLAQHHKRGKDRMELGNRGRAAQEIHQKAT
jgi:hypothetical protein